jgi:hypothetical protein
MPPPESTDRAIIVREWDAEAFHRRVLELETQGYAARAETYRITPEMSPESGRIIHLYSIEMRWPGPEQPPSRPVIPKPDGKSA